MSQPSTLPEIRYFFLRLTVTTVIAASANVNGINDTAIPVAGFSVFPEGVLSLGTELFSSVEGEVPLSPLFSPVEDDSPLGEVVLLSDGSSLFPEEVSPLSAGSLPSEVGSLLSVVGSLLSSEVLLSVFSL